jgi:hypothetical protein
LLRKISENGALEECYLVACATKRLFGQPQKFIYIPNKTISFPSTV